MNSAQPAPSSTGSSFLAQRGLKPASELAANRPHGDRLRYIAGCRCDLCRKANSTYERERQKARAAGDWNGIVDAGKARQHLMNLSQQGVGRRAVAAASDVAETVLMDIRSGTKTRIRARTERQILAVTPEMASDHALVDAGPTWKLVRELLKAGFTKARLSAEMGTNGRALQLAKDQVTVRNAARMVAVHARLMASDEALVPAGPSLRRLKALREEEFTERQLARWLDLPDGEYVIPQRRLTRGLEKRIIDLYDRLMN